MLAGTAGIAGALLSGCASLSGSSGGGSETLTALGEWAPAPRGGTQEDTAYTIEAESLERVRRVNEMRERGDRLDVQRHTVPDLEGLDPADVDRTITVDPFRDGGRGEVVIATGEFTAAPVRESAELYHHYDAASYGEYDVLPLANRQLLAITDGRLAWIWIPRRPDRAASALLEAVLETSDGSKPSLLDRVDHLERLAGRLPMRISTGLRYRTQTEEGFPSQAARYLDRHDAEGFAEGVVDGEYRRRECFHFPPEVPVREKMFEFYVDGGNDSGDLQGTYARDGRFVEVEFEGPPEEMHT